MTVTSPPIFIVYDRAQALAVFAAADALNAAARVETAPELAIGLGPAWLRAFLDASAAEGRTPPGPVAFDCGDSPGLALAALRLNLPALRFHPAPDAPAHPAAAIVDIAARQGCDIALGPPQGPVFRFAPPRGKPDPIRLVVLAKAWLQEHSADCRPHPPGN